jgi:hypothetical protein
VTLLTKGKSYLLASDTNFISSYRYDFVLEANQTVGNYWIKAAGLKDCKNYKAKQTAILRYEGATKTAPTTVSTWESMVGDNKKIVVGFSLRLLHHLLLLLLHLLLLLLLFLLLLLQRLVILSYIL